MYINQDTNSYTMKADNEHSSRFCLDCKEFLPLDHFQHWCRRTICTKHYNERTRLGRKQECSENPLKRQANVVWQIAYVDGRKIYKQKINITPAQVLSLLESHKISADDVVRLVPRDPCKALAIDNFCLTSPINRIDMSRLWKKLGCKQSYDKFFNPAAKRPIYASSCMLLPQDCCDSQED